MFRRRIIDRRSGRTIAGDVRLANSFLTRLRGLMFRRRLGPEEALWLRPCQGVHTFWMLFAIDVVFLDRELRIIRLVENLRPFRLTMPMASADSVIELSAGTISRLGLRGGELIGVERVPIDAAAAADDGR